MSSSSNQVTTHSSSSSIALVFGGNSEIGRAVIEGLKEYSKYDIVYTVTSRKENNTYLKDGLNATVIHGDLDNPNDIRSILLDTMASSIFLVTTTELPVEIGAMIGYTDSSNIEYETIQSFFHIIKECYNMDHISRHIIFAIRDNVHDIIYDKYHKTGTFDIIPLDDGSIVPHYSAKGKGGQYGMEYLKDTPELKLTLLTLPFLFSNFLGFFAPLPSSTNDENHKQIIQWTLTACFGDGHHPIDMMSSSDLSYMIRKF